MNYKIRNCTTTELAGLVELCIAHAAYEKETIDTTGMAERLEKLIFGTDPGIYCLVVESAGTLIGYATYTFDYSTWSAHKYMYMDCLYLMEQYRGYQIGKAIMLKLFEIAKDKDCINIQWQTPDFNLRAVKFYNTLGATAKPKERFTLKIND